MRPGIIMQGCGVAVAGGVELERLSPTGSIEGTSGVAQERTEPGRIPETGVVVLKRIETAGGVEGAACIAEKRLGSAGSIAYAVIVRLPALLPRKVFAVPKL